MSVYPNLRNAEVSPQQIIMENHVGFMASIQFRMGLEKKPGMNPGLLFNMCF
jgi:hypothetical protein